MFDNVLTSLTGEHILIASEPKLRVTSFESGPGIPSIRSRKNRAEINEDLPQLYPWRLHCLGE